MVLGMSLQHAGLAPHGEGLMWEVDTPLVTHEAPALREAVTSPLHAVIPPA
jgi:hypothetical protein